MLFVCCVKYSTPIFSLYCVFPLHSAGIRLCRIVHILEIYPPLHVADLSHTSSSLSVFPSQYVLVTPSHLPVRAARTDLYVSSFPSSCADHKQSSPSREQSARSTLTCHAASGTAFWLEPSRCGGLVPPIFRTAQAGDVVRQTKLVEDNDFGKTAVF